MRNAGFADWPRDGLADALALRSITQEFRGQLANGEERSQMSRRPLDLACRSLVVLTAVGVLLATGPAARGDDVTSAPDAAGDCSVSPCADLVAASATVAIGALVFKFDATSQWGAGYTPLPEPQVWIWTTSPDTAPPDAVVGNGFAWVGDHGAYDMSRLLGPSELPSTHLEYRVDSDFLVALHGRFRWRAALPANPKPMWQDPRPVDPAPADAAPDQGSIEFAPADRDGDAVADGADPCPDEAYSDPLPGWYNSYQHRGCPVAVPPFSRDAFVTSARRTMTAFRALWRDPRRRAAAYRHRRIDVAFRVPAGAGNIRIDVKPPKTDHPTSSSVFGVRTCSAGGSCIVHLKVVPAGVRAYASMRLRLIVTFFVGSGHRRVTTDLTTPLRMPLPRP